MIEAVNGDLHSSEVSMLPLVTFLLLSPPLLGDSPSPLRHGQSGILDEVLLFGAPLVVTLLILAIASRRGRRQQERVRNRSRVSANLETPEDGDARQSVQNEDPEAPPPG
jgi:hypothetical protein